MPNLSEVSRNVGFRLLGWAIPMDWQPQHNLTTVFRLGQGELMYPKKIAEDTAKVLQGYLTFEAVRLIIQQFSETNPGAGIWLSHYASEHKPQNDEAFLASLMLEHKELVLRILTVREHIAEQVLEFVPEMVRTNITAANINHRRQVLERLTQSQPLDPASTELSDLSVSLDETLSSDGSPPSIADAGSDPIPDLQDPSES